MKNRRLRILLLAAVLLVAGACVICDFIQGERQWQLSRAAFEGDFATVKRCLKAGANPDAEPPDVSGAGTGLPAITAAAYSGHVDIVHYLLVHGANPNLKGTSNPLIVACWRKHPSVARLLLDHGADPNARGEGTPLLAAEANEQADLVVLLRRHGAHE